MTALETQLTEIVEKEQGQKIIPFLQKLTQEERESLIPCLSRLEEYYNKFVQLEERTYGTRATSGQHHIIDLAALVIFPLKEFRKHECINGKTNCSLFSKHFAQDFVLLTQNKMYILLFPIICFSDFVLSLLLLS